MLEPLRVLVVEDEAAILMQLEALVEDEGHKVVGTAMTSEDAVALITTTSPELVLLDLRLGDGFTGLKVARQAKEAGVDIVFMTANASQADSFEGAMGVLAKPFSRIAVAGTLQFIAECIKDPPPKVRQPAEFTATAAFMKRIML